LATACQFQPTKCMHRSLHICIIYYSFSQFLSFCVKEAHQILPCTTYVHLGSLEQTLKFVVFPKDLFTTLFARSIPYTIKHIPHASIPLLRYMGQQSQHSVDYLRSNRNVDFGATVSDRYGYMHSPDDSNLCCT
jgi:hypothetical protein